ncbi:MAG: hypothetical protein M3416_17855 [Acidobacteriota bacterium]|nr:hypothetical protein [Acidobacteriota bacterium]
MIPRRIRRLAVAALLALCGAAHAQARADACHVYVVDVEQARKALDAPGRVDEKAILDTQVTFPEFRTVVGEEQLTTKTYPFPGGDLFITASVYYTDEMMASSDSADSMLLGILVAPEPRRSAVSGEGAALAEVTYDGADTVRVKRYVEVGGRPYLVGLECRAKPRKQ